jgi:hypothetical protein
VQIAEDQLGLKYNDQVAGWLLNQYEAVGNNDAYLQLQIRLMREEPQV